MEKKFKYKLFKFLATSPISNLQFFKRPLCFIFGGNTAYSIRGEHQREIINNLKIGDVLLRRWDRYIISNMSIKGYWKHVGVYVGDNKVVHATTKGVIEEDILTFLRCDHCAVLRATKEDRNRIEEKVPKIAYEHLGKKYDFLFETDDNRYAYCSEIVDKCYHDFDSINIKPITKAYNNAIVPNDLLECGFEEIITY
jgi:hypothetical protein